MGSTRRAIVCLPTYDERENLAPILEAIHAAVPDVDVLVIDDASPDGTGTLADEIAGRDPRVKVLHRACKEGLGKAYLAGFAWALERGYELVLEMDADFSHDPRRLPELIARSDEADLVLGSRWVDGGGSRGWGFGRRLVSRGGSLYARAILGLDVRDLTGGFKCFRREVLEALDLGSVASTGYAFQIELTFRAVRAGFRVIEVPIVFADRRVGRSKMSGRIVLEAVLKVWAMRFSPFARGAPAAVRFRTSEPADDPGLRAFLAAAGLPADDVETGRQEYVLAFEASRLVGSVGLERAGPDALVRSLAVAPDRRGRGLGAALDARARALAFGKGAETLYLLTTTAVGYAERVGYERIDRAEVPAAVSALEQFRALCPSSAVCLRLRLGTDRAGSLRAFREPTRPR